MGEGGSVFDLLPHCKASLLPDYITRLLPDLIMSEVGLFFITCLKNDTNCWKRFMH